MTRCRTIRRQGAVALDPAYVAGRIDGFLETGNVVAANAELFREMLRAVRASARKTGDKLLSEG